MSILTEVKEIANLVQKIDNIELNRKILDLQAEVMELIEENGRLCEDSKALRDKLRWQSDMKVGQNSYWCAKDGDLDGPFCTNCWDASRILIRLVSIDGLLSRAGNHKCPKCSNQMDSAPPN